MPTLRNLLSAYVVCFAVLMNAAVADPPEDNRPRAAAGINVFSIDDRTSFESHAAADTALKSKKIELLESQEALRKRLDARGKANGVIVIVDGAEMFANPTQAYVQALALVKKHGKNATYIFVNEPSAQVLPTELRGTPLRASGPINASGLVDLAIRDCVEQKVFTAAEMPERITLVSRTRAEFVLTNPQLGRTATPSDSIPWPNGHKIVTLAHAPFHRVEVGAAVPAVVSAITGATTNEKVSSITYEVLGGERAVVGERLLALASECRVGVRRTVPFRINIYTRGDDSRSAVTKLEATAETWLPKLNGPDHLPDGANRPNMTFSVDSSQKLYGTETKLDGERTITVRYYQRGFLGTGFGGGERTATFTLRYQDGRIYIKSDTEFPGVSIRGNKNDGVVRSPVKGEIELEALEGPAVEVRIETSSKEKMSVMLIDPLHRNAIVTALYPRTAPDFVASVEGYNRNNSGTVVATTGTPGGAAVAVAPGARIAPRISDPSVYDPLKQFFPPLNENVRKRKLPYAMPSTDVLKDFERKTIVSKKGLIIFVIPDGMNARETLDRVLHEVTVSGTVPGLPRNQPFMELRPSLLEDKFIGETGKRVEIANTVAQKEHVYLVNYDLTSLTDFGRHSQNSTNALMTLLPSMENDRVTVVAAATEDQLENFLRSNPEFRPVVGRVDVGKVTDAYVFQTMDAFSDRENRPRIPDALKKEFITESNRFSARGGQPERVLDFLANYYPITDDLRITEHTQGSMRKALAIHYGLSDEDFDPRLKEERINRVRAELAADIIGMERVKDAFLEYLDFERREMYRGRRYPSFLLAGPPGLAKTVIVRKLAKGIVGDRFHEINMGGPAGQSIGVLYRAIANAVAKNADAVIFFDEIEKATREVQEALLKPMWDRVLDYQPQPNSSQMERISLHSVRFFAASNAATEYLQSALEAYDPEAHAKATAESPEKGQEYLDSVFTDGDFRESIKRRILDSLLSRFEHNVFPVFPLTKENFQKLIELKITLMDAEFSKDLYIGPVQAVNRSAFAKEYADKVWSRKIDIRNIEGRIRDAYMKAVGRAQDDAGRAPGVQVPTDCQKLLIELTVPK